MSMPSPFEIGQAVGGNISGGIRSGVETSALDEILRQAQESNDPRVQNDVIRQILTNVSPEKQKAALSVIEFKQKQMQKENEQKYYNQLAADIERKFPNNEQQAILASIYRSGLPADQKNKIAQNVSGTIPYRGEQQQRLAQDSILRRYNSRLKELTEQIKNAKRERRPELQKKYDDLVAERDFLLGFKALEDQPEIPKEPETETPKRSFFGKKKTTESNEEKIKFDPNNPVHLEIFEQLDTEYQGNREMVNKKLSERFRF